jgi:hypothetical protein
VEHREWHEENPNGYCLYCGGDPKDVSTYLPPKMCTACEANARSNEAGGYPRLAAEWREWCRNGHKGKAKE